MKMKKDKHYYKKKLKYNSNMIMLFENRKHFTYPKMRKKDEKLNYIRWKLNLIRI